MKSARVRGVPEELKFFRSTRKTKRDVMEKGFKRNKQGKIKCKRKRDDGLLDQFRILRTPGIAFGLKIMPLDTYYDDMEILPSSSSFDKSYPGPEFSPRISEVQQKISRKLLR